MRNRFWCLAIRQDEENQAKCMLHPCLQSDSSVRDDDDEMKQSRRGRVGVGAVSATPYCRIYKYGLH